MSAQQRIQVTAGHLSLLPPRLPLRGQLPVSTGVVDVEAARKAKELRIGQVDPMCADAARKGEHVRAEAGGFAGADALVRGGQEIHARSRCSMQLRIWAFDLDPTAANKLDPQASAPDAFRESRVRVAKCPGRRNIAGYKGLAGRAGARAAATCHHERQGETGQSAWASPHHLRQPRA